MLKSIYLARPIDRHRASRLDDLTETVAALFAGRGVSVYRPECAFTLPEEANSPFVLQANMAVLSQADVLVVLMPTPDTQTWGVPQEIVYAVSAGIPVVLATDCTKPLSWSQQYPHDAVCTMNVKINGVGAWADAESADWLFRSVRAFCVNFYKGENQ